MARDDNIVVTKLTLAQMNQIAQMSWVQSISLPDVAVFDDVSQGVEVTFADDMHAQGITGNGITVAVIDDSFFPSNPEISGNIIASTLFDSAGLCSGSIQCGATLGNSHGTAVSEIVVDMAPNVRLVLYAVVNTVDFANAIDAARARGDVDIITASLGFLTEGGDGTTGFFRDGTSNSAKAVDRARDSGILVTVSAGNDGKSHWKGIYSASPVIYQPV